MINPAWQIEIDEINIKVGQLEREIKLYVYNSYEYHNAMWKISNMKRKKEVLENAIKGGEEK